MINFTIKIVLGIFQGFCLNVSEDFFDQLQKDRQYYEYYEWTDILQVDRRVLRVDKRVLRVCKWVLRVG